MYWKALLICAFVCGLSAADKKPTPEAYYRNDEIEIRAKVYADKSSIQELVGSDLGGFIVAVQITVTPKTEKALKVYKDDFVLRSDKDGQRSEPYSPGQIAGKGALVVTQKGTRGAIMGEDRGPIWGGMGGGRPGRMGGDGGGVGNTAGGTTNESTMKSDTGEKDSELLFVLKKKALPEGETEKAVSGLLYFPMEGKHKVKDLELQYKGPAGKFSVRFK
jgi:hypothetical protein